MESATESYRGFSDGLTFLTSPFREELEITGPMSARLFLAADSSDADIFLVVRVFDPGMREVTFQGHIDPHTPVAQGWLRASHRRLDPDKTLAYRPYHTHDEIQPLTPGEVYKIDVEILPSCIVIPKGFRLGLSVLGRDYVYSGATPVDGDRKPNFTGVGQFRHNDGKDRPPHIFDTDVCLHTGGDCQSYLLVPEIPPE
jgi:predicted acyl esterase